MSSARLPAFRTADLRPSLNLELDLGLDSMQRVELLSRIEEQLGGNVEESQLAEIYTVRDLIDAVLEARPVALVARERGWRLRDGNPFWRKIPTTPMSSSLAQPQSRARRFLVPGFGLIQMVALDRFRLEGEWAR